MAIDYKVLQAMSTTMQRNRDPYCPECGRRLMDPGSDSARRSLPVPWHPPILLLVGVAFLLTFGPRFWASNSPMTPILPAADAVLSQGLRGDLWAMVFGGVAVLVGLGSPVRWYLGMRHHQCLNRLLMVIWGAGEALIAGICILILALFVDLLAVRLGLGIPLSRESFDQAIDGVVALISIVASGAGGQLSARG